MILWLSTDDKTSMGLEGVDQALAVILIGEGINRVDVLARVEKKSIIYPAKTKDLRSWATLPGISSFVVSRMGSP